MKKHAGIFVCFLMVLAWGLGIFPVHASAATAKINKTAVTIGIGEQTKLSVSGTKKTVKWSSDNKKVATVSGGTVTGVKEGQAVISAKVGKEVYQSTVTVTNQGLNKTSLTLIATQKETLKLNNVSGKVTWSSGNKKVATVDKNGKVKAVKAGKTTIKAKAGKTTYRCSLTIKSSGMNKSKTVVYTGKTVKLKVIGNSGKAAWSSGNKKVAKVDSKGKVTGIKAGKATIKAKIGNKTYQCKVTVKEPYLKNKSLNIDEGSTAQINLKGATIKSAKSSDKKIAKVSKKGKVTAVKEGKCTVTVTDTDKKTYQCKITVSGIGDINTNEQESPYLNTQAISIIKGESYSLTLNDNSKAVTWSSDAPGIAEVTSDGVILAKESGMTTVHAAIDSGVYSCTVQVVAAGSSDITYTRGEWIHILLEKLGKNTDVLGEELLYYYSDTEGTTYGKEIETAKYYGILPAVDNPEDVPVFMPDAIATREFAALTVIQALGYQCNGTQALTCSDADQVTYKDAVAIALSNRMFSIPDNVFAPTSVVTEADKVRIWNAIDEINTSVYNVAEHSHVVYGENVIVNRLKNYTDYTVATDENGLYHVTINNDKETSYLKAGKMVILPANAENPKGFVLVLNADAVTADNKVTMSGSKPEDISTVVSSISYAGHGEVNEAAITAADGVAVSYDKNGRMEQTGTVAKASGAADMAAVASSKKGISTGTLTFDFGEGKKIGKTGKLSGSVKIELPEITAVADIKMIPLKVNEITVTLEESVAISGGLEFTAADSSEKGNLELGRIPIALGATGLSADIVFELYYDAKAGISVEYRADFVQGIQYKNGNFRFIGESPAQSLELPKLEGSAKVGIELALNLTFCEIWDLIGVDGKAGPAVTASATNHADAGLLCVDGTVYLSLEIELNPETIIGEFLKDACHYTLSKDIFDNENSPLKLGIHFENLKRVPECTYGTGAIEGYVYTADTTNPIKGARVMVYQENSLKASIFTDEQGRYKLEGISAGDYTLKVSATGYKTYTDEENIRRNDTTYVEVFMMVDREGTEHGTVSGNVYDAVTGNRISADYAIRSGWNNTIGEILQTGSTSGTYSIELAPGNYTIQFTASGYITASVNAAVVSGYDVTANATLSPETLGNAEGQLRIVLTWGATPRDLDSHLFGPTADGKDRFHVYFADKVYNYGNVKYADLDVDDTTSYGPETVTLYQMNQTGTYSYYVHDYTNGGSSDSKALSNSGAKVAVYIGNTLYGTYNVPANAGGTVWHVFDFDASTRRITMFNTMSYSGSHTVEETMRNALPGMNNYESIDLPWFNQLEEKNVDETDVKNNEESETETGTEATDNESLDNTGEPSSSDISGNAVDDVPEDTEEKPDDTEIPEDTEKLPNDTDVTEDMEKIPDDTEISEDTEKISDGTDVSEDTVSDGTDVLTDIDEV